MSIQGEIQYITNKDFSAEEINHNLINSLLNGVSNKLIPSDILVQYLNKVDLTNDTPEEIAEQLSELPNDTNG